MKPKYNKDTENPSSDSPHHREEETTINARLLYPYVGEPGISYEIWSASLHAMVDQPNQPMQFRLTTGADGELALNTEFAMHLALLAAGGLMGAIALDLIEEGHCVATRDGNFNNTNELLDAFRALAVDKNHLPSYLLYEEITVDKYYRPEIYQEGLQYVLKYKICDGCITFWGNGDLRNKTTNTGEEIIYTVPRYSIQYQSARN